MAKIGIFWVYKNTVLGRARDLVEGEERVPGILDSRDTHVDLWENDSRFVIPFPELRGTEYQRVPRGRVVYYPKHETAVVYADKTLHADATKSLLVEFFELHNTAVVWKTDSHYRVGV